jgi:hypothetical protein
MNFHEFGSRISHSSVKNVVCKQGDQTSLWKTAQNVAQLIFLSKLRHNLYHGKNSPSIWATHVIFWKVLIVNNRTIGENLPNVVTLFVKTASTVLNITLKNLKHSPQKCSPLYRACCHYPLISIIRSIKLKIYYFCPKDWPAQQKNENKRNKLNQLFFPFFVYIVTYICM